MSLYYTPCSSLTMCVESVLILFHLHYWTTSHSRDSQNRQLAKSFLQKVYWIKTAYCPFKVARQMSHFWSRVSVHGQRILCQLWTFTSNFELKLVRTHRGRSDVADCVGYCVGLFQRFDDCVHFFLSAVVTYDVSVSVKSVPVCFNESVFLFAVGLTEVLFALSLIHI